MGAGENETVMYFHGGRIVGTSTGGDVQFLHTDHLGSPVAVTDIFGDVVGTQIFFTTDGCSVKCVQATPYSHLVWSRKETAGRINMQPLGYWPTAPGVVILRWEPTRNAS